MTDNLYNLKKRMRPEWYCEAGPVKIYTREEIDEWEKGCHDDIWRKIEAQEGMKESDIKFLDAQRLAQAEQDYKDLLEGNTDRSPEVFDG